MCCVHALIDLLEVRLPHTSSIITIRQILETTAYKSFIPALKGEAFSCKHGIFLPLLEALVMRSRLKILYLAETIVA